MARLKVRELAEAQGLDMAKLSRRADVAYRTIVRMWHNPEHDASISTLEKIAKALGVRVVDLIADEEELPTLHLVPCSNIDTRWRAVASG
ncbi:MAG TPA: helix-turn-helix transcriptional regulator [Roseiflexaceae bacterium]|nr:helix-turn-helix transcriptional regulator [Roseiflexaceae bacterium]